MEAGAPTRRDVSLSAAIADRQLELPVDWQKTWAAAEIYGRSSPRTPPTTNQSGVSRDVAEIDHEVNVLVRLGVAA
jgi:hypothetical protein